MVLFYTDQSLSTAFVMRLAAAKRRQLNEKDPPARSTKYVLRQPDLETLSDPSDTTATILILGPKAREGHNDVVDSARALRGRLDRRPAERVWRTHLVG